MPVLKLSDDKVRIIKDICAEFGNHDAEVLNVLRKVQNTLGYLPAEVQEVVAQELHMSVAKVYGIVSFYSFFTMQPKGKHPIDICLGAACMAKGGDKLLEAFKKQLGIEVGKCTADGKFSLSTLRCVGSCALAPVVAIGGKIYGKVTADQIPAMIAEYDEYEDVMQS
ncbi:MAG: NAD(P)H-dependent oxidoreductase subunit E [Bacteroidales bacterium]|nr:NAD(P)H-dependent oxidoreductase subunit E [Bacteroidales bacterium]